MHLIIHAGREYIVSDRFADALRGHIGNRLGEGNFAPEFFGFHYYREAATMAITVHAQVLINPLEALVIEETDVHQSWDEPEDTSSELFYLTSWKGETHMFQGDELADA